VLIANNGDFTFEELQNLVLMHPRCGGRTGTNVGLPARNWTALSRQDVVYGYNSLPPYSQKKFRIGNVAPSSAGAM